MSILNSKIDFAVIISAENANPNGDPLNGNRPRETFDGMGEISDVCIKRKIRNRLQDMGERIFVQSDDRCDDGFKNLKARAEGNAALQALGKKYDRDDYARIACEQWFDVRSFGQVFAFKGGESKGDSVPVRGPVSIRQAISVSPVSIVDMQITKSVNSEGENGKSSDTMGMKHFVEFGVYVVYGSINCQLAEKTGFTEEDSEKIKEALKTLFENDCSSARPDGSMQVCKVIWWKHDSKIPKYSSAKVHGSLKVKPNCSRPKSYSDYDVILEELEGLKPEIYNLV